MAKRGGYWKLELTNIVAVLIGTAPQHAVITKHRVNTGHDFNWNGVKIDEEKSLNKRLISVMIFIHKQKQV